jgi:ArsR family transcriptional regulator
MPFDEPLNLPPAVRVCPSAATELSWLLIACGKRDAVHALPSALTAAVDDFWQDGETMLTEIMVIAQQLGCLTGWDIDPLLHVATAQIDAEAAFDLSTEPEHERVLVRERLRRLDRDPGLRGRYEQLLRAVWADAEPQLRELGMTTVDRCVARMSASLDHGQSALELLPENHISCRQEFLPLARRALADGTLMLSPSYLAGTHGHVVALPGLLHVAVGTGVTSDMARQRAAAESVAREMKLLSDPTRVLILTELDRSPATVSEIAQRVGVAQPTASVHVRQLREAGLLEATRDGSSASYRVVRVRLRESLDRAREALAPAGR